MPLVHMPLVHMPLVHMPLVRMVLFAHERSLHAVLWNWQQIMVLNTYLFTHLDLLTRLVVANYRNTLQ
jgi:hypothetical protein